MKDTMKDVILSDNQSTVSLFCNPSMVKEVTTAEQPLQLSTNGGELTTNNEAQVPGFGKVWFNNKAITNMFSFAEMEDKCRITCDSQKERAFIVHMPDKQVKFQHQPNGLYTTITQCDTGNEEDGNQNYRSATNLLNTVEENKSMYTDHQVAKAKRARELCHAVGTPSIKDFKAIITMNCIKNNPVTIEDIDIAEKTFGPDIGALKGKTTHTKPAPVIDDFIETPKELIEAQQDIVLCMDGMKINGTPFLTTVSRHIRHRTTEWIKHQTTKECEEKLNNVIRICNRAGFKLKSIHCDNEFQPLMQPLQDKHGINMNCANAQEHVPEAECNNRITKERVRATHHRLPHNRITRTMIKILAMESTKKLNFFPPKGGVSKFYSPRMTLHQENLDCNKQCIHTFGSCIQAHDEPNPKNTQAPRTTDCICL